MLIFEKPSLIGDPFDHATLCLDDEQNNYRL